MIWRAADPALSTASCDFVIAERTSLKRVAATLAPRSSTFSWVLDTSSSKAKNASSSPTVDD